jgi:hypothetical protein
MWAMALIRVSVPVRITQFTMMPAIMWNGSAGFETEAGNNVLMINRPAKLGRITKNDKINGIGPFGRDSAPQ